MTFSSDGSPSWLPPTDQTVHEKWWHPSSFSSSSTAVFNLPTADDKFYFSPVFLILPVSHRIFIGLIHKIILRLYKKLLLYIHCCTLFIQYGLHLELCTLSSAVILLCSNRKEIQLLAIHCQCVGLEPRIMSGWRVDVTCWRFYRRLK